MTTDLLALLLVLLALAAAGLATRLALAIWLVLGWGAILLALFWPDPGP